jgi:hypothetical protein
VAEQVLFLSLELSESATVRRARGPRCGIYNGIFFDLVPVGGLKNGNGPTLVNAIISTSSLAVIGDDAFLAHEVVLINSSAATPHSARADVCCKIEPSGSSTVLVLEKNYWTAT